MFSYRDCKGLEKLGYTNKKTTSYKEQSEEQVEEFNKELEKYNNYQVLYIDETGFNEYFYRINAWSKKGETLKAKISGKKFQRFSLLAGQIDNTLLAPMIYKDTMTSDFFEEWFEKMLMPELKEKTVIVLDNARFHRMNKLRDIAKKFDHVLLPLPPYSPDLNPIEKTWANIKKFIRKIVAYFDKFEEALF